MKTSEKTSEILSAFTEFQKKIDNPEKNRTVKVKTKKGNTYSYDYATLDSIVKQIQEKATEQGLSFSQEVNTNESASAVGVSTYLFHESGQWIKFGPLRLTVEKDGRMNANQAAGSTITYARRYALAAMAGLASEEDTDTSEITDSGSSKDNSQGKMSTEDGTITAGQQEFIYNLYTDKYDVDTELADYMVESRKDKYIENLSKQEASDLIEFLKEKEDKAQKWVDEMRAEFG